MRRRLLSGKCDEYRAEMKAQRETDAAVVRPTEQQSDDISPNNISPNNISPPDRGEHT